MVGSWSMAGKEGWECLCLALVGRICWVMNDKGAGEGEAVCGGLQVRCVLGHVLEALSYLPY